MLQLFVVFAAKMRKYFNKPKKMIAQILRIVYVQFLNSC